MSLSLWVFSLFCSLFYYLCMCNSFLSFLLVQLICRRGEFEVTPWNQCDYNFFLCLRFSLFLRFTVPYTRCVPKVQATAACVRELIFKPRKTEREHDFAFRTTFTTIAVTFGHVWHSERQPLFLSSSLDSIMFHCISCDTILDCFRQIEAGFTKMRRINRMNAVNVRIE